VGGAAAAPRQRDVLPTAANSGVSPATAGSPSQPSTTGDERPGSTRFMPHPPPIPIAATIA
jgi:hypothetical protein